jgi:hypothetical protein
MKLVSHQAWRTTILSQQFALSEKYDAIINICAPSVQLIVVIHPINYPNDIDHTIRRGET